MIDKIIPQILNISAGEEKWNRRKAPSANPNGPQIDHTYPNSSGYFLITELNAGNGFDDIVALYGPRLQETSENCKLTFWIHMGTNLRSSLFFYFINATDPSEFTYLDSEYGPLGDKWVYKEITLGSFPAGYQLEIYSYPDIDDFSYYADIALDGMKPLFTVPGLV